MTYISFAFQIHALFLYNLPSAKALSASMANLKLLATFYSNLTKAEICQTEFKRKILLSLKFTSVYNRNVPVNSRTAHPI